MLVQQQVSCSKQKCLNSCIFSSVDSSYSQMIAEWPIAVLVLCSVTVVVCTLAGLLVGNLPDFSEPLMVSPYRQNVNMNVRNVHRPTIDTVFLPYKISLCFLPSLQIEAGQQIKEDTKATRKKWQCFSVVCCPFPSSSQCATKARFLPDGHNIWE